MAFNPLAGIDASVTVGETEFAFSKWGISMKCVVVKANNFTTTFQMVVGGLISATLSLEAETYDEGNMPFSVGDFFTFILGYTSEVSLTVEILIETIEVTPDIENGQPVKISGPSNGEFSAAIT